MRRRRDEGPNLRGAIVCCLLALAALSLGPSGETAVRAAARDAARPGFLLARGMNSLRKTLDFGRWPWTRGIVASDDLPHDTPSDATEIELRRLRAELASARGDLAAFESSLGPVGRAAAEAGAATGVERVPARVLNVSDPAIRPGGFVVEAGSMRGVGRGEPAVEAVTLAAGEADGIAADAVLLAGAAVVGRTDEVGAWTSTVLPLTASDFRAHVRIVRDAAEGPVFGEEGLLEGDGRDGCVVKYVPSTSAVSAGDHVYSHDPSGRIPQPLYFGRIESASLRDGAPHWEIRVRPAADLRKVEAVHVLCPKAERPVQTASK